MRRGDIVIVVAPGNFGKPRPAVAIQGDALNRAEPNTSIVALMTSDLRDAPLLRLAVEPTPKNGLKPATQIQISRIVTLRSHRISKTIGRLADDQLVELNRLLALAIGGHPDIAATFQVRDDRLPAAVCARLARLDNAHITPVIVFRLSARSTCGERQVLGFAGAWSCAVQAIA